MTIDSNASRMVLTITVFRLFSLGMLIVRSLCRGGKKFNSTSARDGFVVRVNSKLPVLLRMIRGLFVYIMLRFRLCRASRV